MEITKAKKGSDDYLMDWADYVISDLVKEKQELFKAYNYYNGVRDHYQYENLEKNYGVGNPTSVGFTPLTRKHIDAIVGEYLTTKPKPRISCKDKRTLTNIFRDKQLEVTKQVKQWVSRYLENEIYKAIIGQVNEQQDQKQVDEQIDREIKELTDSVNRNFISNYEIAAQDICEYVLQNRQIDFMNKLEQLLLDLLISGQAYYKVVPTHAGTNFRIELCDPLNTWVDKDPKSRYMKNAYKAVVRKWMTPEEIEIKYGDYLSPKELKEVREWKNFYDEEGNFALITGQTARCGKLSPGILAGAEVHPFNEDRDEEYRRFDLVPVYEVEWIDSKKEGDKWIGYAYNVTRIGQDIYVLEDNGVAMPRDIDGPNEPRLSINGIWYTNGHGGPYSLMLATADLQDKYDLNLYLKDNAAALSGTRGAIIDVSMIPEWLGDSPEERVIKFQAYRKVGTSLIDSAQEGLQNLNTIYNGFDDSLQPGTIQAYQLAIQMIEDTVSSITGVFRERLGGIEQRDAVANVEVGMQQSYIITKRYYQAMDTLVKEMLTDCIDIAKIVYKEGLTGQIILGDQREIINILPEYYSSTSYDINLADTAEIMKEQELIKQLAMQLVSNNQFDPELLLIVSTSKSLTEMKELAMKSIREKKLENSQIQQLTQQLEQAQQQQKQMQKQLEESTRKIAQLNEKKLNIELRDQQIDQEIEYAKIRSNEEIKMRELDLIEQRNKLEAAQLLDNNPNNDEVINNRL